MEENVEYEKYKTRMEQFPCVFNLVGGDQVISAKLKSIQHNLDSELEINDNCENERIIKLNLLTWIRFRLDKQDEAVQLSNEAVDSTERRNIASLGNRFFVMWQTGDEVEAEKCLTDLENMKSEQGFHTRLNDALAEQAYYYSRFGGPKNLQRAIRIYSDLLNSINYLHKFRLGLVYQRAAHANIFCSSSETFSKTVEGYQKRAAGCLFEVAGNADSRLRSLAYAQLATLRRNYTRNLSPEDTKLFHGLGVQQFCDKALEHGQAIPTVLRQCGKAIKPFNIDQSIDWLTTSVVIKANSAAYHYLGLSYKRKAEKTATGDRHQPNTSDVLRNRASLSDRTWNPQTSLKGSARRFKNESLLDKDDINVQEALKCFKQAINIAKENLPAVFDLGILLKETKQIHDALKQFNSITNNYNPARGHGVTVISAYEQAGLCYLKLSQEDGNDDYEKAAKDKLTKAVSMASDLSIIMPELQGSHKEVWVAFTSLLAEIDKEQGPYNRQITDKIKVLELAREYGDIVDVIQKLKDTGDEELSNPDIIKTALDSYLKLRQPDNALGYHNLVSMNPAVKDSDWWNTNPMRSLRVKVLLHAISERLREISDSPTVLFQQLFELVFGSCVGLYDPENDQQNDTAPVGFGDVLYVFDTDDSPDEENRCPAVKATSCLRKLSTCLFGLETRENLKGTGEYGEQCSIQLKEMLKYQVVIIVLGDETRNPVFNAMLERVSYNKPEEAPPNQKILVIDAGLQDGKIPQCLQQFRSLKLEDIGILDQLQTAPETWDGNDHISFTEIINHVDVDAVLKLFCFMIEQTWPCP